MGLARRRFMISVACAGAALAAPAVHGGARAKVVVVGGGAGGASVARQIALDAAGQIDVTLIEPSARHTTCYFSNLYLGGLRSFESLQHGYEGLTRAGVQVVADFAAAIDRERRRVVLGGGGHLPYDRLVLAPGIDFVDGSVPGWSQDEAEVMPHAYKAGPQTLLLAKMIESLPQGGVFAMIAPPEPYRCPPGPYERVSMIAHYLKGKNPAAKIIIIDPKEEFTLQKLFEDAWLKYYDGMIEWIGPDFGSRNLSVSPDAMEISIDGEVTKVDCCNVIPAQKAGKIAEFAQLTDETGWAPVEPSSMRSHLDGRIFVLGDSAQQGDMPKSATSARSQAQVAAAAVIGDLTGRDVPAPVYSNACWSALAPGDSVKDGGTYKPADGKIASIEKYVSQADEDAATRAATYQESLDWYRTITAQIFG